MSWLTHLVRVPGRTVLLLTLGWLCCVAAPEVRAVPVTNSITVTTNYYFAYGATAAALHQSLQQARPWGAVRSEDAQTVWTVRYQFTYQEADGRFRPTSFGIKTKIHVTLPFWQMPKDVGPELRQGWLDYLRALYTHEQGHIDFARQATSELTQELSVMGDFGSAAELRRAISSTHSNVLNRVVLQEKQYDLTTRNGATQGAVLRLGSFRSAAGGRPGTSAPAR